MELQEVIRRRAMVRSFSPEPVDDAVVGRILDVALRAPTAGNTGGTAWVVLTGADETAVYWAATTDQAWRVTHEERWNRLQRAPVVLLAYSSADLYVTRYREGDKAAVRGWVEVPIAGRSRTGPAMLLSG